MALSASTNFTVTRDDIITRALRIVGAIGQGETPEVQAVTDAALVLNMIVKERQADGMQLWKVQTSSFPMVNGTATYNIGIGSTVNQTAPLKVIQTWVRTTATNADSPTNLITKQEYDRYGNKATTGTPAMIYYKPPGPNVTEMIGTFSLYPVPDANAASTSTFFFTGVSPIQDFDASTDNPDFPSYYFNTLTWLLASEIAYEYGIGLQERGQIKKEADSHLQQALSFDQEEGSFFVQPANPWE